MSISDRSVTLECFNSHFVASGSLVDQCLPLNTPLLQTCMMTMVLMARSFVLPLSLSAMQTKSLVSEQLMEFLTVNNILSEYLSGFQKDHSTITASLKVVNDITESQDNKKNMCSSFY